MKLKFFLYIAFTILIHTATQAQCMGGCIDIQLRNTNSVLEVWLMPTTATYTGPVSATFTISWDATYMANLDTYTSIVPEIPIAPSGTSTTVTNGGRKYFVYSVVGGSSYTLTNNTPVKIMEVSLSGSGNATTGHFSIDDDAFTDVNNYNYYIDIGGPELTGATSSIATNVVLPLDLLDFKAVEQDKSVVLNWKTANERNQSHFDIEKNTETTAKNWVTIAQKEAQNGSNTEGSYFAKDAAAFNQSNTVLYRLKMVNQDGSFTYSKVITAQRTSNFSRLKLYPNPVHNTLQLTIESDKNTVQTVEIVDIVGKKWQQTTIDISKGTNQQSLDVQALPSGVYFLQTMDSKGFNQTLKWVKL
jgi:Secretion system C-terminal sorting domain